MPATTADNANTHLNHYGVGSGSAYQVTNYNVDPESSRVIKMPPSSQPDGQLSPPLTPTEEFNRSLDNLPLVPVRRPSQAMQSRPATAGASSTAPPGQSAFPTPISGTIPVDGVERPEAVRQQGTKRRRHHGESAAASDREDDYSADNFKMRRTRTG